MEKKIIVPFTIQEAQGLKAGDSVLITGTLYCARDAAHKKLVRLVEQGLPLPVDVSDAILYYAGPSPAKPGRVTGSIGPTTSGRMDGYTPVLLDAGLRGMIGKGERNSEVITSMKKNKAVYFAAIGGAGALLAHCIKSAEVIAYEELGAEALRKLEVVDFPAVVAIDCEGNNLYESGRREYLAAQQQTKES